MARKTLSDLTPEGRTRVKEAMLTQERRARNLGMERGASGSPPEWKALVRRIIADLADSGDGFISDEVHEELRKLDQDHYYGSMGAMFGTASRLGIIERTGEMRQTELEGGHVRLYPVWIGAE